MNILQPLDSPEMKKLEEIAVTRDYRAGEIILRDKDRSENIFLINSGQIEMVPKDLSPPVPIAKFYSGNIFGEEFLFTQKMPSMDIMIERDSEMILMPSRELKHIFKYNRKTMLKFLFIFSSSLSDKIRKANATLFALIQDGVLASREEVNRKPPGVPCKDSLGKDIPKVDPDIIRRIKTISTREHYQRDHIVFSEGDVGDHMYIIDKGNVQIFRTHSTGFQETLAILEPGDFFGEMAFVDDLPRSASAIITSDSAELIVVPRRAMHKILTCGVSLGFNFLGSLCRILCLRLESTIYKIYHAAGYPPGS